jgi:arginase
VSNNIPKTIKIIEVYSDIAGKQQGASMGINALKESCENLSSNYFENFSIEAIQDENHHFDKGSVHKYAKHIDKVSLVIERLANKIKEVRDNNYFPIVLSGDHSSCAGTMHGLRMAHPNDEIGVVYIDAHADIHTPYTSDSGNMHGMPLAISCALDNKKSKINEPSKEEVDYWHKLKFMINNKASIKTENIVFCAVRDCEQAEKDLIKEHNIKQYSIEDITYYGIKTITENIFKKLSHCKHIYVSFDVDSVDPLYIPGTGTPSENGLSYEQALQLNLELIKNKKVCCWEMSEINPLYNNSQNDGEKIFLLLEKITDILKY